MTINRPMLSPQRDNRVRAVAVGAVTAPENLTVTKTSGEHPGGAVEPRVRRDVTERL
jgi:hypothetical protein